MKKIFSSFHVLSHRNFRLFSIGLFISYIGSQMQVVGISWHIYQLTKSAYSLGLIGLVGFLPMLLFSVFSGVLVDAFDRKKLLIFDQIVLAFVNGIFAIVTLFHYDFPFLIYCVVFFNALMSIIDLPARQAFTPSLVPQVSLIQAFNINTLARQASLIMGPAIAGYMIVLFGVGSIYFVNAFSFFVFLIILFQIRFISKQEKISVPINMTSLLEGIRFIKQSPVLYSTMLLDFFANFFAASTVIFPIFATEILHISPKEIGLLYAAPAFGAVITGLFISTVSKIRRQGRLLLFAVVVYGIATVGFGLSHSLIFSLICLAVVGGSDMISMVIRRTISQLVTPDHIRGRMNAINMIFFAGGPFLGESEAGFAAGLLGAPLSVVFGGIGAILSVVGIGVFVPKLTNYVNEHS